MKTNTVHRAIITTSGQIAASQEIPQGDLSIHDGVATLVGFGARMSYGKIQEINTGTNKYHLLLTVQVEMNLKQTRTERWYVTFADPKE